MWGLCCDARPSPGSVVVVAAAAGELMFLSVGSPLCPGSSLLPVLSVVKRVLSAIPVD